MPISNVFNVLNVALTTSISGPANKRLMYSSAELRNIKDSGFDATVSTAVLSMLGRLWLRRTADWRSSVQRLAGKRKRCARKQKRGKRGGLVAKLKANRPSIPSLFLANVRSLNNKVDLICLWLGISQEMRYCAIFCLTETWLNDKMPDSAFQLDGLLFFPRADRNHLSGKTPGGGICAYINKGWCTNCVLASSHCSEAIEHLTVKCRPHHLPREFTAVYVIVVYIPPSAKASEALTGLHNNISSLQNKHPDALYAIAGDFNHADLKDNLPKFYQHVNIPTRGNNTLDRVYTNRRGTYRAVPPSASLITFQL